MIETPHHLTSEQEDILTQIKKHVNNDRKNPQPLTPEEEKELNRLDRESPEPIETGQEDAAFEAYLKSLPKKPQQE